MTPFVEWLERKERIDMEPKCPDCGVIGIENIVSQDSEEESKAGDAWFNVAYCEKCGHVYGVFAKTVNSPSTKLNY
jgi:uncharacterized Zn finger protein